MNVKKTSMGIKLILLFQKFYLPHRQDQEGYTLWCLTLDLTRRQKSPFQGEFKSGHLLLHELRRDQQDEFFQLFTAQPLCYYNFFFAWFAATKLDPKEEQMAAHKSNPNGKYHPS